MNKKILLIGNDRIDGGTGNYHDEYVDFFRRSLDVASAESVTVEWTLLQDLYIQVGDGSFLVHDTKTDRDIADYDVIMIRGKGLRDQFDVVKTISSYANIRGVKIINDYSSFRDSSKLMQAVQFFQYDLPVSSTVYVNRAVLSGKAPLSINFPCVMKAVFGAHGEDNYVVNSMDEVRDIVAGDTKRFVLQRFVPNNGDYRILVVGDSVRVIGRKATTGSHLNNTSQGGSAALVDGSDVPESMLNDSLKISRALDMSIAGVDALIDTETGEYSFLEVNSQPQLMSGAFVEEKEQLVGEYLKSIL